MLGFVQDVPAFWRETHIACLPSRGGEGLPRSLIEAAASGRPIVTTDVPGCRDFVLDGESGHVVPSGQPIALATALARLAQDPVRRKRMGEVGRQRVLARYTTKHVEDLASSTWARALQN
jgi:glycosyltransferase involved in cell wall biosynthesis